MRARRLIVSLALAGAVAASARVGETGAELRKRMGKPEAQPAKNVLVWLVEESAGPLLYTVTLNEIDVSIAEGLKPYRQAKLLDQTARAFVAEQLAALPSPNAARAIKSGETYTFAGEKFVGGADEQVVVDDANGLLVVWTLRPIASVLAATPEMVARPKR